MKFLSRFMKKSTSSPDGTGKAGAGSAPIYQVQLAEVKEPPPKKVPERDQVVLELGDFLHRIPAQLLLAGPHDLKMEIRFNPQYLSERIANGETTIPLAEIYNRVPTIFRGQIRDTDQVEIRFPWQKIARLVRSTQTGSETPPDLNSANLAAKLRAKMPSKKNPATSSGTAGPILPGRGNTAATWFSKPAAEQPAPRIGEMPAQQSVAEEKTVEPAAAPDLETAQPSAPEAPSLLTMPSQETAPEAPPQGELFGATPAPSGVPISAANGFTTADIPVPATPGTPLPAEAPEVTPSKLEEELRISDLPAELQRRIARFKGHYERQIGELERVRKNHTAEVVRLQEVLSKSNAALTDEKIVASAAREMSQTAQADRDRSLNELAEMKARLASIEDQSGVSEITAERDALLVQKAHLSAQIAELARRTGPAVQGSETIGGTGNRQNDEMQRRIAHMESAQRETALELAREKEARSKAEKLLASAEKLQEQSANYMESTKVEMRKEIEASVKVREIEFRKAQKELNDQIASLSGQLRIASTDLENATNRIAGLEAELQSATPAQGTDFQSRMIEQLEEDITNYRERLKILIAERDTARQEAQQAKTATVAEDSAGAEELARLREAHAAFATERAGFESRSEALRQALDAAREAHAMQIAAIQKEQAGEHEAALSEAARASDERAARVAELEAEIITLKALVATATEERGKPADTEKDDEIAALREKNSALEQRVAALSAEQETLAEQNRNATASHAGIISRLDSERLESARVNEELRNRLADLERSSGSAEALETQVKTLAAQVADATSEKDKTLALLAAGQDRLAGIERELAAANDENRSLRDTLAGASATQNDRASLAAELENLQRQTAALQQECADRDTRLRSIEEDLESKNRRLEQLNGVLAAMEEDLTSARRVYAETAAELAAEKQHVPALRAEMQHKLDSAMRALVSVRAEAVETARHRDELLREIARFNDQQQTNLSETDVSTDLPPQDAEPGKPADIIEIIMPEDPRAEIPNKISIPFARPVPVPPPRVNRG